MRKSDVYRKTKETEIRLKLNIDGKGKCDLNFKAGFFNHMLENFCKHSLFDIQIDAKGDIDVDFHHLVEDIGICLGEAFSKALGKKEKITRFGWAVVPMDETLVLSAVDISGRPFLGWNVKIKSQKIGSFDTELIKEFFKAFVDNSKITLHIILLSGNNTHHIIEAIFKSVSKALSFSVAINEKIDGVPSTKNVL
jgi:imidazoleglycerol-phosphate dehydratase